MQTLTPLSPGHRLGKFEIVQLIASEGQAHVYLARLASDPQVTLHTLEQRLRTRRITPTFVEAQRLCIIKLASPDPDWIDCLRDEHNFLLRSEVRHPRVITLFVDPRGEASAGQRSKEVKGLWFANLADSNGTPLSLPYIALTYLPGGTLKQLLEQRHRQPLPPATVVRIALQVAEALKHLHTQAGIIHHDVSPSNIVLRHPLNTMWPQTPDCVLIDLAVADMPDKPRRSQIHGKKIYLPPERLLDLPNSQGPLVDVYGLGVVIYECLVGQLPRTGTDAINKLPLPLPPIRTYAPRIAISDQLASLVNAAVEHDPLQRPSLQQLVAALEHTPEAKQDPKLRSGTTWRTFAPFAVGMLVVVVVLLFVGTLSMLRQPSVPPILPSATPTITTGTPTPSMTLTPTIHPSSTPVRLTPPPRATAP